MSFRSMVHWGLQPLMLVIVLLIWGLAPENAGVYLPIIIGVQVVLGVLEYQIPARPDWLHPGKERFGDVIVVALLIVASGMVAIYFDAVLTARLEAVRQNLGLDIWPHEWPLVIQLLMVFFFSEFIWYWIHRAEHRFNFFWRISGHGAHHSFKKLGALNFGLNHPLELFLIALPAVLIELTFGVGIAAAGAAVLATTQASIAHANLDLNSRGIGWLFTTNEYHIHHHSVVLEESNTNYGCSAIIWDRIFGTFEAGKTLETGTGPTEPTLWQKFIMPVKEPGDTATAPS